MERYSQLPPGWFVVRKTSNFSSVGDTPPCDGAVYCRIRRVDRRGVGCPSMLPGGKRDWFSHGDNHRIEHGNICRDMYPVGWIFQGDILDFVKKNGMCVVEWDADLNSFVVEIYDDYRE